jgi:HTH-type transcriptional regulator / antitoxin HigA
MKIRPIRSESDYEAALDRMDEVFDAAPGTEAADLRDVLSILIEKYEDDHFAIEMPNPIEAIRFRMDQMGLKQVDLIPLIGSRSKVSEILGGKRPLTLRMIRALHEHLGIPAELLVRTPPDADLVAEGPDPADLPITEMAKNGAFGGMRGEATKVRARECLQYLVERAGGWDMLPVGLHRKAHTSRQNANLNPNSLFAWQLQVLAEAQQIGEVPEFRRDDITDSFINALVRLSVVDCAPKVAMDVLQKYGIIVVLVKHLKKTYVDGAAFVRSDKRAVIGLSGRFDRIDNFWFTLLHEIAHVKLHLDAGGAIVDDMSLRGKSADDNVEREADDFAQNGLLPPGFGLHDREILTQKDVIAVARDLGIHPAIVAGRIQHERSNYRLFSNLVGRGEIWRCI